MRDIRFKAKRKDNGEWIEGYYNGRHIVNWEEREVPVSVTESKKCKIQNMHTVIPETVCQYTGLKDKDGQEIWESDIVENKIDRYVVTWSPYIAMFLLVNEKDRLLSEFRYIQVEELKIIGNIFDNPDLIESR